LSMATEALKTITLHHELLKQRKDVYIQYLENARKGQAQITVCRVMDSSLTNGALTNTGSWYVAAREQG